MRREGRLTGYTRDNDSNNTELKRRVKVFNKATNGSKDSGKCKRPRCRGCHSCPPTKAMAKAKGVRNKAKGLDVVVETEWALHNAARRGLKMALHNLHHPYENDYYYDDDDEDVGFLLDPPAAYGYGESEPNLEEGLLQTHMRRAWPDPIINAQQAGISMIKQGNLDDNYEEIAGHHLYNPAQEDEESQQDPIGESEENLPPHASDDDASSDWYHVVALEVQETQEEELDEWYFC